MKNRTQGPKGTQQKPQIYADFLSALISPIRVIRVLFSGQATCLGAQIATKTGRRFAQILSVFISGYFHIRPHDRLTPIETKMAVLCVFAPLRELFSEQATRPADTDNDENRNADYAEDADFTD